jgi:methylenetetrahydrofolate reductase (NADPH)
MMPTVAPRIPPAAPVEAAQRIAAFLRDFSLEATRPTDAELAALKSAAPLTTQIYLSAVPTRPQSDLIGFAARVRAAGFEPIPHLAARDLASTGALDDLLARMVAEAKIRRILVIAGDRDHPQGPFTSALELIESGLLQRHGIVEIGIAGYPEGHPRIPTDALDRALAAKIEAAEQTGLGVHIVTQFGFSAEQIIHWISRLRDQGIEHAIRVGMAGPTNLATLMRYAHRCGVAASAQGLTRQGGLLKHLVGTSAPDGIVRTVAEVRGQLGEVAAHFFSFGGIGATARWAAAAAAGRIVLDRSAGFGVSPP